NSIVYSLISLTALTLICSEINDIARLLNEKELFRRSAIANYEHLSYILVLSGFTMNLLRFFYNHYILKMITYGFYGVCLSGLFVLGFDNSGLIIPVLNLRTIVWLSLIALTVKLARKNTEYKVHFTYLALALCSGLIASEAMLFITSQGAEKLAVSASLLIYSITVLFTGLKFKVLELRRFATVLTSLIIAKVFIFDLAFLNELERIVGFAFLGATLLGASHFYNKQK
ncbi:MAG TPA: hypothetical protein DCL21_03490, partial [Alphaproteobacteria bacterium]|nr:hypothetical protein [Alphaproteobacteria bacterium]